MTLLWKQKNAWWALVAALIVHSVPTLGGAIGYAGRIPLNVLRPSAAPAECPRSLEGILGDQRAAIATVHDDHVLVPTGETRAALLPLELEHYGREFKIEEQVDGDLRNRALPFFDHVDLLNTFSFLKKKELDDGQRARLMSLIAQRAYGKFNGKTWASLEKELAEFGTSGRAIDRAITEMTDVKNRPGVRVMIPRKNYEPGYINPENVPNGALLVIRGNPILNSKVADAVTKHTSDLMNIDPKTGKPVDPKSGTTAAVVFMSDIHIGRPGREEANFIDALNALAKRPPATLVIGGDLLDAPTLTGKFDQLLTGHRWDSRGNKGAALTADELARVRASLTPSESAELARITLSRERLLATAALAGPKTATEPLSRAEAQTLREERFERYAKLMREKLPNTDIQFLFGNHDIARLETLPPNPNFKGPKVVATLGKVQIGPADVPSVPLEGGRLGGGTNTWQPAFRKAFSERLAANGKTEAAKRILDMSDADLRLTMQEFYAVRGEKTATLHTKTYLDEKSADERFAPILLRHGIKVIGTSPDTYYTLSVPNPKARPGIDAESTKVLLVHEPQEGGPNIDRIVMAKEDTVYGRRSTWPSGTRVVMAFDQHTQGTISFDFEGNPVAVHAVGSMTNNANAGQGDGLSFAVLDPTGLENPTDPTKPRVSVGNTYHFTFAGPDGGFLEEPRLSPAKQLNYYLPPPPTGKEPPAIPEPPR